MNEDPFSSFGTDPSSSFGSSSFDNSMSSVSDSFHDDAHSFATSMMTGFPIDGSSAAITGAMMHTNNDSTMSSDSFSTNSNIINNFDDSFLSMDSTTNHTRYCKYCGTEIRVTASYCKKCGKKL